MRINMDNDWKFFLGDVFPKNSTDGWGGAKARAYSFGAVSETFDDSMWRSVDIPHDFVVEGDYTQKKVQGSDMQKSPKWRAWTAVILPAVRWRRYCMVQKTL